jgi:glutathione peroxidase
MYLIKTYGIAFLAFSLFILIISSVTSSGRESNVINSVYDFTVKNIDGKDLSLSVYKGKVLLIVNVASECGYTKQYSGLQELYNKYKTKGLVILGFPCNQFGEQEPGNENEIKQFCSSKFGVNFPLFSKIDVNGVNSAPLYKFLKNEAKGVMGTEDIKWNFTKFLVDKNGKVVDRYASKTTPDDLTSKIEELLK